MKEKFSLAVDKAADILKSIGIKLADNAKTLIAVYGASPTQIGKIFKDLGVKALDAAKSLMANAFNAQQIGEMLKNAYSLKKSAIKNILKKLGFERSEIQEAIN